MKQSSKTAKLTAKIEKENKLSRILVFILLGLSVVIAAWLVIRPSTKSMPIVVSLEDKWGLLETSADKLQSDTYLSSSS